MFIETSAKAGYNVKQVTESSSQNSLFWKWHSNRDIMHLFSVTSILWWGLEYMALYLHVHYMPLWLSS
jgi:hypothetical protein